MNSITTEATSTDRTNSEAPDVSVILPIFNAEPYLREALDSAIAQTHHNVEIICVNDGSTDASLAIMQEYASHDPRIVIDNGPNGGYGRAMNRGIGRAHGRYIAILEPDDTLMPTMFEDLLHIADRDKLDFVRADFNRFTANDDGDYVYTVESICHYENALYNKILNPQDDFSLFNVRMQNWTGITRRSFINDHRIRFHESPGARFQDNSFWFQTYCWATRIEYVNQPYYCHRDDNPNSSTNRSDLMFAMLDEWQWIRDYLAQFPDKERQLIRVYHHRKFHNCNFAFGKLADDLQLPYLERFSRELNEAREAGELDLSMFSKLEVEKLELLLVSPSQYMQHYREDRSKRRTARDFELAQRSGFIALFAYYVRAEGIIRAIGHVFHGALRRLFSGS